MPASLELRVGGRYYADAAIPQAFLDSGVTGIRAFAWEIGSAEAADQVRKGNEIAGIFVDGVRSRGPDQMKRDIVWEFSLGNAQLVKAVQEALGMLKELSRTYAAISTGRMSESWNVYINGKKSSIAALDDVVPGKDDVRVTSDLAYARFLEAGYWTGSSGALKRESKRGVRALSRGKQFRASLSVTHDVARKLRGKYRAVGISDLWFDQNPGGGPRGRWPAITFNKRKRAL
jgi:hypothetical protein